MTLPFLPYSKQFIDDEDREAVSRVLQSDWLTQGPEIASFEEEIAQLVGAKYAVAVSNGTTALHLAYLALGLKPGDEVITTPNSFVATSNAALYCGASVRFADIDPQTGQINLKSIQALITPKTKIIVPVHFSGCPVDLSEISTLAHSHNIAVVEDAAHALGARYKDTCIGDCTYSELTTFSFHPVKPITMGEGGIITTQNEALYRHLLRLRTHGIQKENMSQNPGPWYYEMVELGFNYRTTDFQAALGRTQLKKLKTLIKKRNEIANAYTQAFTSLSYVTPLSVPDDRYSGYHLYGLQVDFKAISLSRSEVMEKLKEKGIGSQVHYIPIYHQPFYKKIMTETPHCPNMEIYYSKALSIPLYPGLSEEDVLRVIDAIEALNP